MVDKLKFLAVFVCVLFVYFSAFFAAPKLIFFIFGEGMPQAFLAVAAGVLVFVLLMALALFIERWIWPEDYCLGEKIGGKG